MKLKSDKKVFNSLSPILLVLVGILTGFFIRDFFSDHARAIPQYREIREGGYNYINPLVACQSAAEAKENSEIIPLKQRIEKSIEDQIREKRIADASVYFRLLDSGKWVSIRSSEKFSPASLLKVPVMIIVLNEEEKMPHFAEEKIEFSAPTPLSVEPNYKPSKLLKAGESYTVDDLLYRMIVYSDNNAMSLLLDKLDRKFSKDLIDKLYQEFGVPSPQNIDYMTVEEYAAFFRILYNATYLSREMSEKALSLLVKTEFKEGLNGGVPSDIPIAHKFGERQFGKNNETKQMHDCGIVYYPNNPYLLCVMTRGNSFEYLDNSIREISRIVYEDVDHSIRK